MSETTGSIGPEPTAAAEALLADFPVVVQLPLHWGEMDAFGHLNNVVYFRYFETARIHYFERCGFMATYEQDRGGAILHSTSCRVRRSSGQTGIRRLLGPAQGGAFQPEQLGRRVSTTLTAAGMK